MKSKFQLHCKKQTLFILLTAAITASLMILPLAMGAADQAPVDDFVLPIPIVNPQTPDQEYFNMRLEFFLPETEPLIKETFGSDLRFEEEAFWEYESYYSRAVSFATNLPSLAKIEYGLTTDYEMSTKQTESYYYQHVFHLTGLEPGNDYHYRIKVKGSDGAFLASKDYTFTTPAVPSDIIRIPDDLADKSLPYRLTRSDAKYLLTQDVYAPNGGIVIKANNVEVDLGGHTIVYDNELNPIINEFTNPYNDICYSEEATFGIRSGLWNFRNQSIFNGAIIQGKNGGSGQIGIGYNPIFATHMRGMEIAGVIADYYGESINGIEVDWNNYIHHNVVFDRGSVIDNRHSQMRAITVSSYAESHSVMAYNSVRRCRQTGIVGADECYGNEVYGDSFASNSFLLGYRNDSRTYSNKVFGLGYHCIGIGGSEMSNAVANNNFIYLHAYATSKRYEEYDWSSSIVGFRGHIYNDDGPRQLNNLFENNIIIVKAWIPNIWVRGIQVTGSPLVENLQIKNNIVVVEVMSDDVDIVNQRHPVACVNIYNTSSPSPDIIFSDNLLRTNATFVCFGFDAIGSDTVFYRTTFEKINHHDSQFWTFRMLDLISSDLVNNRFIDSIAGPGVDLTLPPLNTNYSASIRYNLAIGVSSARIYADAATGAPLSNKTVSWRLDGGGEGSFITDVNGGAYREWITVWNEHKPGEPAQTMSQIFNSAVTFYAEGYEPLTMNIAEIQGTGSAILFGKGGGLQPLHDPKLIAEEPLRVGPGLDANTMSIGFWTRVAYDQIEIYRSDTPGGPFQLLRIDNASQDNGYRDSGLKPDTVYYYKVRLLQGEYAGPMSGVYSAKTNDVTVEGGLRGGAGLDANTASINFWTRSVYDGIQLYRSDTPDGPYALVNTEYNTADDIQDFGLKPVTTYYYKVRLIQEDHIGAMSAAFAITTNDVTVEGGLRGGAGLDANTASINFWTRSVYDGIQLYRSDTPDGPYSLVKTEYTTTNGIQDFGLNPATTYYYKVRLIQGDHIGAMSAALAVKTNSAIAEDFRGRANENNIELSWWCRSDWDYAEVYRAYSPDGDYIYIGNTTVTPYFDYSVIPGITYYYKTHMVQNGHVGSFSNIISFTAR